MQRDCQRLIEMLTPKFQHGTRCLETRLRFSVYEHRPCFDFSIEIFFGWQAPLFSQDMWFTLRYIEFVLTRIDNDFSGVLPMPPSSGMPPSSRECNCSCAKGNATAPSKSEYSEFSIRVSTAPLQSCSFY
jgi:hypothetical protein